MSKWTAPWKHAGIDPLHYEHSLGFRPSSEKFPLVAEQRPRTLPMLSKKQTDAAAEALMHGVRQKREARSPLLTTFPELSGMPADRHSAVLKAAYSAVWRKWPMILSAAVAIALIGLWIWAVIEKTVSAEYAWFAPLLVAIGLHRLNRYLLRRELRRLVEPE